jgi:hypothetical protein
MCQMSDRGLLRSGHGKFDFIETGIYYNGPAIWGGCVTRRKHRAVPSTRDGTLARKLSRCKEGMAHFLPSGYRVLWPLRVSRYKVDRSREFITGYKVVGGHWRSVAVQIVSEPEICQGAGF